jgi:hypothetical protein
VNVVHHDGNGPEEEKQDGHHLDEESDHLLDLALGEAVSAAHVCPA